MKRRGFIGAIFGAPAAVVATQVVAQPRSPFIKQGKFGLVMVDADVAKGDKLFCSNRADGTIDAWRAGSGEFHAIAIQDVRMAALRTGGMGMEPAQLRAAVRFV